MDLHSQMWHRRPFIYDLSPQEQVTFIGQEDLKKQLGPYLKPGSPMPHLLITGKPGMGKSTLAKFIAYERQDHLTELLCPVNVEDIPLDGIVLLDEVHKQKTPEPLFEVMRICDAVLVGATTKPQKLDGAFLSRFRVIRIARYTDTAMAELIREQIGNKVDEDFVTALAKASAGTPRQAEDLILIGIAHDSFDPATVLPMARITTDGVNEFQLRYMLTLDSVKRPIGLAQLAVLLYTSEDAVGQGEIFLFEEGYITLTATGRELSKRGKKYLKHVMEI